jgi:CheY-like chemotaxis protein
MVLHLSASLPRLIGDRLAEGLVGETVASLFHPQDRDRVQATLAEAAGESRAAATVASLLTSTGETARVALTALRADEASPPVDLLYLCAETRPGNLREDGMAARTSDARLGSPPRPTVLICDDEARLGALTAGLLSEYGFAPVTVGTGDEALAALARPEPAVDVVLLDVNLAEGRSAREVLVAMRERGSAARVILTSGLAEEDVDSDLVSHPSVVGYVAKPYAVDHLVQALQRAVATVPS